ncbi:filamentous hemagglutinin N-terminal domain-containing protein [Roseateles sp. BYS96W]|uniref:Filamentous hemagglutinin N-terminal domain-containing protein n=1 Tax=Pelomonas nitida TaxID=3299027 RepID=A0ABW7G4E7_9BURK
MNRQQFRIVFNRRRGLLMAVAEIARGQGKGTGETRRSTRKRARQRAAASHAGSTGGQAQAWRSWAATFGLLLSPLFAPLATAQVRADAQAPKNQQPTVLTTANGTTQVNIQTPSAAGVSRNTYSQFDVTSQGVVLNNSRTDVSTQIGGWVQGNPWLAQGSARLILNEVNSSAASQLKGFVEVAGQRAELVIANPSGIQVDGAGFINARSVTLTTGQPQLSGGALTGYDVRNGTISVNGAGLNAGDADYAAILGRAVELNAGIWAQQLQVVTGANMVASVEASATGVEGVTPTTPAGSDAAPRFALDVSALGGMYAGKITLVGTEAGVGVRQDGQLIASSGNLTLDHNGWLSGSGRLQASDSLQLKTTADAALSGVVTGQVVQLQSDAALQLSGTVAAGQDLQVQARSQQLGGSLQAGRDIQLRAAEQLTNSGSVTAARVVSVQAGSLLDNQGGSLQGARLELTAPSIDSRRGRIEQTGSQALSLAVERWDNADGQVLQRAGQAAATLGGAGAPVAGDGGASSATPAPSPGTGGSVPGNDAGTSAGGSTSVPAAPSVLADGLIDTRQFANAGGVLRTAGDLVADVSGSLDNQGDIRLQSMRLDGARFSNRGSLSAERLSGNTTSFANSGQLLTQGILQLRTPTLDNSGLMFSAAGVQIDADDLQQTAAGTLATAGTNLLRAGQLSNQGLIAAGMASDGRLQGAASLQISSDGVAQSAGKLWASGDLLLAAASLNLDGAAVQANNISLVAGQGRGDLSAAGAQVLAQGQLSATGQSLNNAGGQLSAQQLALQVRELDNRGGSLVHSGSQALSLELTSLDNRGGVMATNASDVTLKAQSVNSDGGQLQHAGSGKFLLQAGQLSAQSANGKSAEVLSAGQLIVQADAAQLGGVQLVGESLSVSAGQLSAAGGQLAARSGALQLSTTAAQATDLSGAMVQAGGSSQITTAGDLLTRGATLSAGGDLSVQVGGSLQHRDGAQAVAAGQLTVIAGQLDVSGSKTVTTDTTSREQYSGFTALGGALNAQIAGALNGQDSQWTAGQGLSVSAQSVSLSGSHSQLAAGQATGQASANVAGLSLSASQNLSASDTLLVAPGAVNLSAQQVSLTRSQLGGQDIEVQASGADGAQAALQLTNSQLIASGDTQVKATAGQASLQASVVQGGSDVTLQGAGGARVDAGSTVLAQGSASVSGASLDNAGTVQAAGTLSLTSTDIVNRGSLIGGTDLQLQGRQLDNRASLYSGGSAQVTTQTLINSGTLAAAGALTVDAGQVSNSGSPEKRQQAQALLEASNAVLNDPQAKADYDNWKEGGAYRVAAHAVVGGLTGNVQGALGAGTAASLAPQLDKLQGNLQDGLVALGVSGDKPTDQQNSPAEALSKLLTGAIASAAGGVVGGAAGAAAGLNEDFNNRQLHPSERDLIAKLAKGKAAQMCNGDMQCVSTETRYWTDALERVASGLVDDQAADENKAYLTQLAKASSNPYSAGARGGLQGYLYELQTAQEMLTPYMGKTITVNGQPQVNYGSAQTYFSATAAQKDDPYLNSQLGSKRDSIEPLKNLRDEERVERFGALNGAATPIYPVEELVLGTSVTNKVLGALGRLIGVESEVAVVKGSAEGKSAAVADSSVTSSQGTPVSASPSKAVPGKDSATMNGELVTPQSYGEVFHGTNREVLELGKLSLDEAAAYVKRNGLPARGGNIELTDHISGLPDTAFRGTTNALGSPTKDAGALYWAGDDGLVVEIVGVKGYDLNAIRDTSSKGIGLSGIAQGKATGGELEISIPAQIPPQNIGRIGKVWVDENGKKQFKWITLP